MYRRRLTAVLAGAALAAGGLVAAAPSRAAGPVSCPAAFPTASAVDGLAGVGWTVDRGTAPAPFTATLLGRITDGIAPGVDMIMAQLSSAAIDKPGVGVWAGMSGSPVYAPDGRLIGSVSYGLAASSPIAGITPAAEMKKLLTLPAAAGVAAAPQLGRARVAVPAVAVKRLAATGRVTAAQAAAGFQRLPVPVSVSGLTGVSSRHAKARLDAIGARIPDSRVFAGAAAPAAGATPSQIGPGSNFVAAVSYGDATLAGTGTTTFVCAGKAVAFGHPFLFTGKASMSVHPATAVLVQPDPVFGSFKVANPGGVVGRLDNDRLAGIRGILGSAPVSFPVVSHVTAGAATRTGRSTVVDPSFADQVVAVHTLTNIDRVIDQVGPGSAALTLTVKGVRADGTAFTLVRRDRIGSGFDVSSDTATAVFDVVSRLLNQPFEQVRLTSVTVDAAVTTGQHPLRVGSVKVRQGGVFVTPTGPVTATAGGTVAVRVGLLPFQGVGSPVTVNLAVPVPAGASGTSADLTVLTGSSFTESTATTFPQLLTELRTAPRGDSVRARLTGSTAAGKPFTSSVSATVAQPVDQSETGIPVDIG